MNALRLHSEELQPTPGAGVPGDPVASWLDVLEKLLGGTAEENKGIRDELASHLRERVRDLTVSGMAEAEAVRTAIGELGEAAELARRFQQARGTSTRRKVMQIALATAAVIALGAGGLAVRGSVQAEKAQREAAVAREHALTAKNEALTAFTAAVLAQDGAPSIAASPVEEADVARSLLGASWLPRRAALASALTTLAGDGVDSVVVSCGPTDTWQQFFDNAAKAAGKGSHTNFTSLDGTGIDGRSLVGVQIAGLELDEAVRFLNEGVPGLSGDVRLAYRAGDAMLEFASESYFDRREQETRTYDLEVLVQGLLAKEMQEPTPKEGERHTRVAAEEAVCDQVRSLIEEMVHPPMWQNNGGNLASVRRFGSKMFVTAPRRHFQQVEWVLKECGAFEKPRAMIAPGSQKLSVDVDPATSELVISDDRGATVRCRSLRMETPQLVAAMMEDARVQTGVPLLSELPLLNHNFRSEARLMTLMLRTQPDGTLEVQPALAPAADEAPDLGR